MTQWLIIIFVWDDILDDPEEDNLMDDASGAHRINRLMTSVFDHHEITEKQAGVPIVAAFHAYVKPSRHRSCSPYLIFGH